MLNIQSGFTWQEKERITGFGNWQGGGEKVNLDVYSK